MTTTRLAIARRAVRIPVPGAVRRAVVAAPLVVVCLLVADYLVAWLRPGTRPQIWLYWTAVWATPIWFAGALLLVAFPAVIVIGRRLGLRPLLVDGGLAVLFTLYCFGTRISPPTGDQMGWWQGAATDQVAASEALAEVVHKVPYWLTHDLDSVRLVPPVFGAMTICAYLLLARRVARMTGMDGDLLRVFAIATPLPFWFVAGYIENTFLGLPFLLLALERVLAHVEHRRLSAVLQGALLLGVANAVHLLFLVMTAAVVGVLLLIEGSAVARARDAGVTLALSLLVPAVVIGLLLLTPLHVHPGNTNGGFDKQVLTPWVLHPGEWPNRFVMVSHAHLIEVDNIVVQAAPLLVLALPVLLLVAARRRGMHALHADDQLVVWALPALAFIAFVAVFGFDYGPVGDLDLMLVLSFPLSMLVLLVAARVMRSGAALTGLVLGCAVVQFAFYTLKVATAWTA